jgi:hypothetical protein
MDDGTNHSDIAGDTDTGPSAPGAATDAVTPRAHQKACPARTQRTISCPAELPECPGFLTTRFICLSWSGRCGWSGKCFYVNRGARRARAAGRHVTKEM